MSIESIKDTTVNIIKSAGNVVCEATKWTGRKVIWLKDTVVSWDLPSKTVTGAKWTLSKVQAGWEKTLPLLTGVAVFLITNNGLALLAGIAAVLLLVAAEKCPPAHNNSNIRVALNVAAVVVGATAGFLVGTPTQVLA